MHLPCGDEKIALDHGDSDSISFFSHAHSDHLHKAKKANRIIASDETIALAELRGEKVDIDNAKLYNAGHILGAKQLKVEHDGKSVVYTGDICLHDTLISKGAEILECDKLIMEATYGSPDYKFPDYSDVCEDIAKFIKQNNDSNIIIGTYELGKAQELIKIINQYCGMAPLVSENMERFCGIYEKSGVKLDRIMIGSEEAEKEMQKPFVALVAMRHAKRYFARRLGEAFNRKTLATIATGWSLKYKYNVDYAFPLSDHADFYDLREYIKQSNAKEIEFFQGDGSALLK